MLKKKIFGKTILCWLNVLILQWLFIRLYRNNDWTKYGILKWIWPVTGWWNDYKYLSDGVKIIVVTMIALLILFSFGCSSVRIDTHHGFLAPDVYELTDGSVSYFYYNGDCCCVAKEVLENVLADYKSDKISQHNWVDKEFMYKYIDSICIKIKEME